MQDEVREYVTFTTTNREGKEIELAVVDEFEYEHKPSVVGALIEGDMVNENALFIFQLKSAGEEIVVGKIINSEDYQKIAQAYMEMEN